MKLMLKVLAVTVCCNINISVAQNNQDIPIWYLERVFKTTELGYLLPFEEDIVLSSTSGINFLLKKMKSPSEYDKTRAIGLLGRTKSKDYLPLFKKQLGSQYPYVIGRTLFVVSRFNDQESISIINDFLNNIPKNDRQYYDVIRLNLDLIHKSTDISSIPYLETFIQEFELQNNVATYYKDYAIKVLEDIKRYHKSNESRINLLEEKLNMEVWRDDFTWAITKIINLKNSSLINLVRDFSSKETFQKNVNPNHQAYPLVLHARKAVGDELTPSENEYLKKFYRIYWSEEDKTAFIQKNLAIGDEFDN